MLSGHDRLDRQEPQQEPVEHREGLSLCPHRQWSLGLPTKKDSESLLIPQPPRLHGSREDVSILPAGIGLIPKQHCWS